MTITYIWKKYKEYEPYTEVRVMCCQGKQKHGCGCQGPRMERFIQPCMLLLLHEKPAHGYELMDRLKEFGFEDGADPGLVYRNLRRMEEEGWIKSEWETEGAGPAKRLYKVTAEGISLIHDWSLHIESSIQRLRYFQERYRQSFGKDSRDNI
jgi:PadR family transcriptional regulator PadR